MKDTVYFAIAMISERLVSFFLLPILTKNISVEEYAIWSQSIIISGVLIPVILLGFQTAIIKFFPLLEKEPEIQRSVLLFMLVTIILFLAITSMLAIIFDHAVATLIFGRADLFYYIPLLVGLLASEVLFEFLVGILRATGEIKKISFYLLLKGIWRFVIMACVIVAEKDGFYTVFWGFITFQFVITILIYAKEVKLVDLAKSHIGLAKKYWPDIFRFSLPLLPLAVLTALNNFTDRLFLAHYHGLESVANYSAAFSLAAIAAFFYSVLGFTLFPSLAKYWADQDMKSVVSLMRKVMIVYLALIIPYLICITIIGDNILLVLASEHYKVSKILLFFLTCNIGLFGFYQISFYLFLLQNGSMKAPIYMGIAVIVNLTSNILLIPYYGLIGAAISGFLSNSFLAALLFYVSQRNLPWQFPWQAAIRILLRSLVIGGILWLGNSWLDYHNPGVLALMLIFTGLLYVILDFSDKKLSFFAVISPEITS